MKVYTDNIINYEIDDTGLKYTGAEWTKGLEGTYAITVADTGDGYVFASGNRVINMDYAEAIEMAIMLAYLHKGEFKIVQEETYLEV